MSRALETIEADETISTVMMSGYAVPAILGGRLHEGRLPDSRIVARNAEAFELAMSATFERLIAAEKKVIYFIDNPELRVDPRACARSLIWHASSELCSIPRETMAARNKQYREIAIRAQAKFPSITFIDSVEFFCDTELCYAAKDGRLWYQTQDHLSPVGSKHLVESAAHKINAALAARSVPRLNEMAAN